MSFASLLQRWEDAPVDAVADGDGQSDQGEVREDAEHREESQRQQQDQRAAEHHARLLSITPVNEIHHYTTQTHRRSVIYSPLCLQIGTSINTQYI